MKTYLLRTLYDTNHLNFTDEGLLYGGDTGARLVRELELPKTLWKITGENENGTQNVTMQTLSIKHRGSPLLLEIYVIREFQTDIEISEIRKRLESKAAAIVAFIAWSLPGTVGVFKADCLFARDTSGAPDKWQDSDTFEIKIEGYHGCLQALVSRFQNEGSKLNGISESRGKTISAAVRWLRHGYSLKEPVDKLVSWWIIVEATACELGKGSINQKVEHVLKLLFPQLAQSRNGKRITRMRDVLGRVRHSAVHAGRREISATHEHMFLSEHVALGCISYLIEGTIPFPPRDEWLAKLHI